MIEFDELKRRLSIHCEIENDEMIEHFNRVIKVITPVGDTFEIEWWKNIGYFRLGKGFICFDDLNINSTWPMVGGNLNSIRLLMRKEITLVLPIEVKQ